MWKPGGSNPFSMINIVIATYWLTVFHFARREAGTITPTEAATARSPVTASSRPTITTTIQASILETASSETSAAATSSLSAIGSRSVPSVVTWLRRRATTPSAQSVIAARMKMAAAISAWTRDEEIRNTMSSGTATMRMRVSPMGRFTRRLRPKRRMAGLLSAPWNDLVNAREIDRDERGRVQAQARADVGAPAGGAEPPRPGRVLREARHVRGVAAAHGERREGRRARRGAPGGGAGALHEKSGARVVFERASTPLARAHDDDVQPTAGGPARRGAHVDEGGHPHGPGLARGEECPGAITGREVDGPAVDALDRELDGRVAQVEPGNRLATALTRPQPGVRALPRCHPPGLRGGSRRRERKAAQGWGADPEAGRVQVDEPLGVPLTVDGVRFEGGEVGPVEGAWRAAADDDDVALVEPDPHRARDVARALVHQGLERLALGREPEAVVDHLGVARHEGVAQMEHLAVERERLERPARDVHDRAAGCLVYAPRLHSDEPVLDEVDAPDSVLAAQPVEPGEQRY